MSGTELRALQRAAPWAGRARGRIVSPFEYWPGWLFYTPVVLQWIGLGLRYGSMTLPTGANPLIETGGLCGESKLSILDQVGAEARHWIAPYTSVVVSGDAARDLAAAEAARHAAGLGWPLVVKPDIGCNGTGVRLLHGRDELARYLAGYPRGERAVLQEFVAYEGEAGLFYIRRPDEAAGRITSVTLKSSPVVVGDGRSTLRRLILADPRTGRAPQLYLPRLAGRLEDVPPAGEAVRLVFVGNHCKGSTFRDGRNAITPALTATIDRFARAIPDFYFGRIDIRFASPAALHEGKEFRIIEVNGVGSEATHIWDPDCTLREAYAAQFAHYRAAFEIGHANRKRGCRPAGVRELWTAWRRQKRLMAAYPMND